MSKKRTREQMDTPLLNQKSHYKRSRMVIIKENIFNMEALNHKKNRFKNLHVDLIKIIFSFLNGRKFCKEIELKPVYCLFGFVNKNRNHAHQFVTNIHLNFNVFVYCPVAWIKKNRHVMRTAHTLSIIVYDLSADQVHDVLNELGSSNTRNLKKSSLSIDSEDYSSYFTQNLIQFVPNISMIPGTTSGPVNINVEPNNTGGIYFSSIINGTKQKLGIFDLRHGNFFDKLVYFNGNFIASIEENTITNEPRLFVNRMKQIRHANIYSIYDLCNNEIEFLEIEILNFYQLNRLWNLENLKSLVIETLDIISPKLEASVAQCFVQHLPQLHYLKIRNIVYKKNEQVKHSMFIQHLLHCNTSLKHFQINNCNMCPIYFSNVCNETLCTFGFNCVNIDIKIALSIASMSGLKTLYLRIDPKEIDTFAEADLWQFFSIISTSSSIMQWIIIFTYFSSRTFKVINTLFQSKIAHNTNFDCIIRCENRSMSLTNLNMVVTNSL